MKEIRGTTQGIRGFCDGHGLRGDSRRPMMMSSVVEPDRLIGSPLDVL